MSYAVQITLKPRSPKPEGKQAATPFTIEFNTIAELIDMLQVYDGSKSSYVRDALTELDMWPKYHSYGASFATAVKNVLEFPIHKDDVGAVEVYCMEINGILQFTLTTEPDSLGFHWIPKRSRD